MTLNRRLPRRGVPLYRGLSPLGQRLAFLWVADGSPTAGHRDLARGNAGTVTGTTVRTPSVYGPQVEFDAAATYISFGAMQLSGMVTVLARVYATTEHQGVLWEGSNVASTGHALVFDNTDRAAGIALRNPGTTLFANTAGIATVGVDKVMGFRFRPDGTPNIKFFLDGKVVATGAQAGSYNTLASVSPRIGAGFTPNWFFDGRARWVGVWRGPLSDAEVWQISRERFDWLLDDEPMHVESSVSLSYANSSGEAAAGVFDEAAEYEGETEQANTFALGLPMEYETTARINVSSGGSVPAEDVIPGDELSLESVAGSRNTFVADVPDVLLYENVTEQTGTPTAATDARYQTTTGSRGDATTRPDGRFDLLSDRRYRR